MKRPALTTFAILAASPAFAHGSGHGHVHADGTVPLIAAAFGLALLGSVVARQMRKARNLG